MESLGFVLLERERGQGEEHLALRPGLVRKLRGQILEILLDVRLRLELHDALEQPLHVEQIVQTERHRLAFRKIGDEAFGVGDARIHAFLPLRALLLIDRQIRPLGLGIPFPQGAELQQGLGASFGSFGCFSTNSS